jgi:hypothetical protein
MKGFYRTNLHERLDCLLANVVPHRYNIGRTYFYFTKIGFAYYLSEKIGFGGNFKSPAVYPEQREGYRGGFAIIF